MNVLFINQYINKIVLYYYLNKKLNHNGKKTKHKI